MYSTGLATITITVYIQRRRGCSRTECYLPGSSTKTGIGSPSELRYLASDAINTVRRHKRRELTPATVNPNVRNLGNSDGALMNDVGEVSMWRELKRGRRLTLWP